MCACYLIYYYDMEPWDAIRIMRRQRPGSVERKVQEETVVRLSINLYFPIFSPAYFLFEKYVQRYRFVHHRY